MFCDPAKEYQVSGSALLSSVPSFLLCVCVCTTDSIFCRVILKLAFGT